MRKRREKFTFHFESKHSFSLSGSQKPFCFSFQPRDHPLAAASGCTTRVVDCNGGGLFVSTFAESLAHGRDRRCASTPAGPLKKAMVGSRKICRNFTPTGALFSVFLAGALLSVADSFAPAMGPNCLRQKDAAAGRACRPMFATSGLFRPAANSIAAAADARRLPAAAVRGLAMAEGGGAAASKGKSVLIIAWFYAEPKQIELVKRIYKKKGFTDIVVQESPVKQISTPRGWYNTFVRYGFGMTQFSPPFSITLILMGFRCCTALLPLSLLSVQTETLHLS
jgi:hypothetical protein